MPITQKQLAIRYFISSLRTDRTKGCETNSSEINWQPLNFQIHLRRRSLSFAGVTLQLFQLFPSTDPIHLLLCRLMWNHSSLVPRGWEPTRRKFRILVKMGKKNPYFETVSVWDSADFNKCLGLSVKTDPQQLRTPWKLLHPSLWSLIRTVWAEGHDEIQQKHLILHELYTTR